MKLLPIYRAASDGVLLAVSRARASRSIMASNPGPYAEAGLFSFAEVDGSFGQRLLLALSTRRVTSLTGRAQDGAAPRLQ